MAKKDKFAQMQKSGGASSFQDTLVQAATTVAAIERQQEQQSLPGNNAKSAEADNKTISSQPQAEATAAGLPRFMRLPNPQIPLNEYNLVSLYCTSLPNMTRQDFVELAIVEKLHALGRLNDDEFNARQKEIRNRPPRGQRKGTKQASK